MTSEEYDAWIKLHAALFFMHSDNDSRLFVAWEPILIGFLFDELKEASYWIASDKASEFRTAHLSLIRNRCWSRRAASYREQDNRPIQGAPICGACGGSGMIVVPHYKLVVDDRWIYPHYTQVVLCTCKRAEFLASQGWNARTMNIFQYEQRVPHWMDLVEERKFALSKELAANTLAHEADEKHGPMVKRGERGIAMIGQEVGAAVEKVKEEPIPF